MSILTFFCISSSTSLLKLMYVSAKAGFMKNSKYPPNIFRCPSYQKPVIASASSTSNTYSIAKGITQMRELTSPPLEMFPPNKSSTESETPVESRRNTEFTFTFSLKTNHGYGILGTPAFTEFYLIQFRINNKAIIIL